MSRAISTLLVQAKVDDVNGLIGKPVELLIENMKMKDWRILEEVL